MSETLPYPGLREEVRSLLSVLPKLNRDALDALRVAKAEGRDYPADLFRRLEFLEGEIQETLDLGKQWWAPKSRREAQNQE